MAINFLLIDDDEDDRILFCEALGDINDAIECNTESSGRKALAKLGSQEFGMPDVIFLDINMPSISGWDVLTKLKRDKRYQDIPVIMYSTSNIEADVEKAQQHGASSFITKPSDFKQLKEILRVIVDHVERGTLAELDHWLPLYHDSRL